MTQTAGSMTVLSDTDRLLGMTLTDNSEYDRQCLVILGRTTHFFGFFTGKQNVSETMPFGENSHSAKFQADISNSF